MTKTKYDVTAIGNAIVDVLARTDEGFLERHALRKGTMALIDRHQADLLYGQLEAPLQRSGGSAGNTIASIAELGASCAYIGKVADDTLGVAFTEGMRASGTHFTTEPLRGGAPTARCIVLVTPDAQRTMNTYLGACTELCPDDVDGATVADSQVTYLEGYLWDKPHAKEACLKAMRAAHAAGRKVALSLSDPFCVDRHRAEFLTLVKEHVDVLFANEAEICSLYRASDLATAAAAVRQDCEVAALTRSADGSLVVSGEHSYEIAAAPVEQVVDTTGAGDLYAAGFLFGFTQNRTLPECGKLGALCAAEVISHFGARPEARLSSWIQGRI